MLTTTGLQFSYDRETGFAFPDLRIGAGEPWLMVGPSGCGKTTYLHLLAGLIAPTAGSISWENKTLAGPGKPVSDQFRGTHIGLVFQRHHFIAALNVRQNLELALSLAGKKPDRQRINTLLDQLEVGHLANKKTHRISQGEQQRVAIARALLHQPALVLADEPTASLDDARSAQVAELLKGAAAEHNAALLLVTHDQRLKSHFEKQIEL